MHKLTLPPKPGEVLLYVELSLVENMTIGECLTLLESKGYNPELRYREWKDADGNVQSGFFALLKHEAYDPNIVNERSELAKLIKPDMAVRCPRGMPSKMPVAA